jgi:hypothetical protein
MTYTWIMTWLLRGGRTFRPASEGRDEKQEAGVSELYDKPAPGSTGPQSLMGFAGMLQGVYVRHAERQGAGPRPGTDHRWLAG